MYPQKSQKRGTNLVYIEENLSKKYNNFQPNSSGNTLIHWINQLQNLILKLPTFEKIKIPKMNTQKLRGRDTKIVMNPKVVRGPSLT